MAGFLIPASPIILFVVTIGVAVLGTWAGILPAPKPVAAQQSPQTSPCDIQLQIVEGGRKQAETSVAALLVRVQTLEAQLREAKAPQDKPAEKK